MIKEWKTLVTSHLVHVDHPDEGKYYVAGTTASGMGVLNHPRFGILLVSPEQIQHFKVSYNPTKLFEQISRLEADKALLERTLAKVGSVVIDREQTILSAARAAYDKGCELTFDVKKIRGKKRKRS